MNKVHKLNGFVYVTSDEHFKENDIITDGMIVRTASPKIVEAQGLIDRRNWRLIILTNDPNLEGVQKLTKEEVEYCNRVDEVKVDLISVNEFGSEIEVNGYGFDKFLYKLIIPTQEEVSKETLDEVELIKEVKILWEQSHPNPIEMALFGAKWQAKQMYTEDDLKSAFFNGRLHGIGEVRSELKYNKFTGKQPKNEALDFSEWFKRFKKQKQ